MHRVIIYSLVSLLTIITGINISLVRCVDEQLHNLEVVAGTQNQKMQILNDFDLGTVRWMRVNTLTMEALEDAYIKWRLAQDRRIG